MSRLKSGKWAAFPKLSELEPVIDDLCPNIGKNIASLTSGTPLTTYYTTRLSENSYLSPIQAQEMVLERLTFKAAGAQYPRLRPITQVNGPKDSGKSTLAETDRVMFTGDYTVKLDAIKQELAYKEVGSFARALNHQAPSLYAALGYCETRVGKNGDRRKVFNPTPEALVKCHEQFQVIVPLIKSWNASFAGTYNEQSPGPKMPPQAPAWDENGQPVELLGSKPTPKPKPIASETRPAPVAAVAAGSLAASTAPRAPARSWRPVSQTTKFIKRG
jgi:hypothetical protein